MEKYFKNLSHMHILALTFKSYELQYLAEKMKNEDKFLEKKDFSKICRLINQEIKFS